MKKLHFTILVAIFSTMIITNNVEAQKNDLAAQTKILKEKTSDNFSQPISKNIHVIEENLVNAHALKDFKKQYKTSDEKWAKSTNGITASFKADNTRYAVYYDKKGHWIATIKSYAENLLEKNIRTMIKTEYSDYNISGIQEIEYNNYASNPTYIVLIQHENLIKWIRINNDMMSVYNEL